MIGWYVDLYVSNTDPGRPANINIIEFDDVNRPWGLPEVISSGEIHSSKSMTSGEYEEILNSLYNIADGFIGFDVNVLYPFPRTVINDYWGSDSEWLSRLEEQIPSIKYSFPNAYQKAKLGDCYYNIIHFRSAKKVVKLFTYSGDLRCVPGTVGNDGMITWLTYNSYSLYNSYLYPTGYGMVFNLPAIKDYSGPESLYDIAKIYEINVDCARKEAGGTSSPGAGVGVLQMTDVNGVRQGFARFMKWLQGTGSEPVPPDIIHNVPPDNPYEPGGDSGEGGGDGTFDDSSDQIVDSTPPTISSANTGFTRIYNPTLSQVQALAEYLWTDESVIQTIWNHIKQYFENPMEAMIGFNLVPVTVPDGGTTTFKLMYIDTGVSMTAAASQFVDTDCGTLKLEPYYGSALDYSPYTKVSIFLPYIGMVSVDTDEVMGRNMQVKYRTDICSGACVAKILVDGNVLYQYTGHCAINIPFSAADFSSYVSAAMSTAKLAGTLALGASGALGPVAVSEITQQTGEAITKTVNTERNPETGRQITSSSQTQTRGPSEITTTRASYAGISPSNVTNTVGEVISSKPHVEHSGSFSGTSGYLGVRRPYVIIKRPNMCMPANYQSLNGFPCMITLKLGDCKGFTRVQQVVLSNMGKATNPEQAEILGLLKNGVIL